MTPPASEHLGVVRFGPVLLAACQSLAAVFLVWRQDAQPIAYTAALPK